MYTLLAEKGPLRCLLPHSNDGSQPLIKPGSKPGEVVFSEHPNCALGLAAVWPDGPNCGQQDGTQWKLRFQAGMDLGSWQRAQGWRSSGLFWYVHLRGCAEGNWGLKLESANEASPSHIVIEHVEMPSRRTESELAKTSGFATPVNPE